MSHIMNRMFKGLSISGRMLQSARNEIVRGRSDFNSVNEVRLMGRLGKDPQLREKVIQFPLATTRVYKNSEDQERRTVTTWHNIVVSRHNENRANYIMNFLRKGSKVYVSGSADNSSYTSRDGNTSYFHFVRTEKIVNLETGGQTVQESSLPVEEAEEFDTADELVPEDRGRDSQ
ncbi:ssb [Bugula neritina]|uniref:Ssb n=1 Tax=Bugula neritina TaxID=10212 RepID=A0A7J7K5K5_BUGNE|nr:ssb [Bugula neritina]